MSPSLDPALPNSLSSASTPDAAKLATSDVAGQYDSEYLQQAEADRVRIRAEQAGHEMAQKEAQPTQPEEPEEPCALSLVWRKEALVCR